MSMTLSFTRVTPEELDRAFEDPESAEEFLEDESRPYCFLEKAWAGIGFLLRAAGVDVDLYEDGDPIDDEATRFGWSEQMIAEAADALGATPVEVLVSHYDPAKLSAEEVYPMRHLWDADDLDYLRDHYVDLVRFFQETAAVGGAAIRDFSF
ncbi:YfbM family protein [Lentzea sp. CC55]|uniref:YfbM family protein n=1 Tax=Lentzea sp. CC55 TaxID=2884909 RepID=UPI001F3BDCAB|nr:YfbM family protein [Lentzea sp. CC55]MCG8926964.1 YfbM family protein [Lentzea sp. CC55]